MAIITEQPELQNQTGLEPVLDPRFALELKHVIVCAAFGAFFLYLNYMPLWHTDLWGHVAFGRWILAHGALPTEDPFMPLAEGMRVVDTTWLAQVIFALIERFGQAEALAATYAITVTATWVMLARAFYLQTRRLGLAMLGAGLVLAIGWSRHAIVRTEIFGSLCFATLLWMVARVTSARPSIEPGDSEKAEVWPRWLWIAVPALFAVWANLHGSYVCGFAVLGCHALGRAVLALWSTRSLRATLADVELRRWVWLTELAVVGTIVNPYGPDLLIETIRFPQNENLKDIMEWYPLGLLTPNGYEFIFSVVLMIVLFRHSRRAIRPADVLLLAVFSAAVIKGVRMIGWHADVTVFVLMPHVADVAGRLWSRVRASHVVDDTAGVSQRLNRFMPYWFWTACVALVVWSCFSFSGLSRPILGGKPRPEKQVYSRYTPLGLTEYLREHPPEGQVWNPQVWGDWLVWDGPPGMKVFMTTMCHLAPRQVWRDYMRVASGLVGWETLLDKYRVNTVIVDKDLQSSFASIVRRSPDWTVRYEDDLAIVLERKRSADAKPDDGSSEPTEPATDSDTVNVKPDVQP